VSVSDIETVKLLMAAGFEALPLMDVARHFMTVYVVILFYQ
jgi:hypothetical protein